MTHVEISSTQWNVLIRIGPNQWDHYFPQPHETRWPATPTNHIVNLSGLVLGVIKADFCKQILKLQHSSRSTRFTHFCTAPNATVAEFSCLLLHVFFMDWKWNPKRPRSSGRRMHSRKCPESQHALLQDRETVQAWQVCHSAGNVSKNITVRVMSVADQRATQPELIQRINLQNIHIILLHYFTQNMW